MNSKHLNNKGTRVRFETPTPMKQPKTSIEMAQGLLDYCKNHESQRFWQALLNYTGLPFIAISPKPPKDISPELEDTFYLEP